MNKSNLDKILKAQSHYSGDLVSLDFKSQSLNKFLQNVVQLVNQHSQRLNQLQMEKINIDRVKAGNERLLNSNKLPQPIINTLPNVHYSNRVESYQDTIEGISANMKLNVHSIQYIYDAMKKKDDQLASINLALDQFQKVQESKQGIRKSLQTSKKHTDDQINKILTRLKQLQMRTNKKIAQFQNVTKQTQKKTLWKITECQSSLLKKVTPEYVERALQQLQLKIHNDIKNNKNQQMNQVKFNVDTLKTRVDALQRDFQQNDRQTKLALKQLQQEDKTFEKKQKSQQDKRQIDVRIKELLIKLDRLQKRQDPLDLQMKIYKITNEHQQKLNIQGDKLKKIQHQIQSVNNVMSSFNSDGGGLDPHKLCHIDGQVRRLRDSNRTNQSKLQSLQQDMKTKLLIFQQRIMTTLGMLKGQDNFVSRQQLYQSLSRLRQPVTQRMNQNQNLINQVNGKLNKLQLFQKATKRKIKQLTRGDQLNKILDMKLNIQQSQTQFGAVNMKLQNLQIIFNKVKIQMQANSQFLQYLQKQMNQPEQGFNIIGPKQKVFPAKCLGCGVKHNPVHQNNMMMGSDGKYYRVDLKNSYTADQKQVYGVTPSQLAVYQSSYKKIRHNSGRPTSSKTNLRPNSASRY